MSLWRRFAGGLKALFDPASADRDVDADLEHYYAESAAELESAGASPAEARRVVRMRLGERLNAREDVRAYGWEHMVSVAWGDVRYAARRLRQNPGFTIAAALTLAVGIGASTTIYSAVRPILFEPLPYPDAGRIHMVWDRTGDGARLDVTYGTYRELLARSRSFAALAVMRSWQPVLTGSGRPEQLEAQRVSADYFEVLGVAPSLGRGFDEREDVVNGPRVVVLSHDLWQRAFAGDGGILGAQVRLDDEPHTVIGIMPRSFENVTAPSAELWVPLQYDDALPVDGREWGHHLRMIGRVAAHATAGDAREELTRIAANPLATIPRVPWASLEQGFLLESLQDGTTRAVRPALLVLLGAALLLLAIACGNVTNLLLAHAARRRGEMALRAVLGAGRSRMVMQLLVESLLLALIGGALGVALAAFGTRALVAISPAELPRMHEVRLDVGALLFALGVTAAVGVAVGMTPALLASRRSIGGLVRGRPSRVTGGDRRIRRGLVVAEIVLAVVLLVNGGLLLRSLDRLLAVDPGFEGTQVLTMQVQTVGSRFSDDRVTHRFFAQALAAVSAVPGVESAAFTSQLPLSGEPQMFGVHLEAQPTAYEEEAGSALRYAVTPGYLQAMRIPLLRGRRLAPADDTASAHVVVVNERLAQLAFGATSPLGQRLRLGTTDQPWATIVGIVGNVKQSSLDSEPEAAVYLPTVQSYFADRALWLVVRARGDAPRLARAIERAVHSVDAQPVTHVATMESRVDAATAQRRMMLRIFQLFGVAALLLAAIGVYGIQAGDVAERINEIGVRSALGATAATIVSLVLREGLALAALGVAIGLLQGASASGIIASMLFGISRFDVLTYVTVTLLLVAIIALASSLPAWRATQVNPSTALRAE